MRTLAAGFVPPCLPSPATKPPAGAGWLHEIKHDGFRCAAMLRACGSSPATGTTGPAAFLLIARAALSLKAASCLIDGEAVACDDTGLPVFDRLRYRRDDSHVFLYAFDLIELNGDDVRHEPIERRKVRLMRLIAKASVGLQINDHIVELGDVLFRHACQLGFEGIFSKRLGSPYRSGRSRHWIKSKNPAAPALKREEEEDWTREKFACASPERFYSFGKIGHGHQETPERDRHSERNRSGPYHVHACLRSMKAQLSGR